MLLRYVHMYLKCQTAPTDSSIATIDSIVKPHPGENVQDTPTKSSNKTFRMEYHQKTMKTKWAFISIETQAQLHLTQIIMMCNILRKRTQRTNQNVGLNDTENSTIPGMADWEAILQMEYSKDPQWALVCVVFLVTLVLVGVWYCGMCKNKHTEYIDPVVTHNLKPEFVKDVVRRKARFLAWFKYLKSRRKHVKQKAESEAEALLSSNNGSEEDLFDQTDMSAFLSNFMF
ncbi:unnamed protein product [Mytilus edulis]|uniref:Uncharacterized protein n=1 Tax=Mytilus edulis TaxID=6550 RepID=A0A8S3SCJ5_MYTED|nr:unnamed protein product [Mytilus edulis]